MARLSRAQSLHELPMLTRRAWAPRVQIIVDRSRRLTPFWQDQSIVAELLRYSLSNYEVGITRIDDTLALPEPSRGEPEYGPLRAGDVVLALSDLGCLDVRPEPVRDRWGRFGQFLRNVGVRPVALLPAPLSRCPSDLVRLWNAAPWEDRQPALPRISTAGRSARNACWACSQAVCASNQGCCARCAGRCPIPKWISARKQTFGSTRRSRVATLWAPACGKTRPGRSPGYFSALTRNCRCVCSPYAATGGVTIQTRSTALKPWVCRH